MTRGQTLISASVVDFDSAVHVKVAVFHGERIGLVQPVVYKMLEPGEHTFDQEPTFRLRKEDLQQWMDEMWRIGIRPTQGHGSTGQLAATERHLTDMRAIAFKACDLNPPIRPPIL
jgi:hypothetical protein